MTTIQQRTFHHGHSSGRFDRSPASLEVLLDQMMASNDLITGTEVDGVRATRLNENGWAHHSGKNGDAQSLYVAWAKSQWSLVASGETYLTTQRYYRQGGAEAPRQEGLWVVLKHLGSGETLAVLVVHEPAGIEGHGGPFGIYKALARRVGVHYSSVKGIKPVKKMLKKKYKPSAFMVGGDWNLNIGRLDVRAFFKTIFPGATPNFTHTPHVGTLGKRIIDIWFLWKLIVRRAPKIHPTPASDHRWYDEVLAFK